VKTFKSSGLPAAVLAACALAAPATAQAAPGQVTVRVEGAAATLQPQTTVTTAAGSFTKRGPCSATSAGGALELATGGDWDGSYSAAFGQSVERIRTENYPLAGPEPRYWSLWVNGRPSELGACSRELDPGDEVLFFVDCYGAGCVSPAPLRATGPASATVGVPFTVRVEALAASGAATPAAGATVSGAGAPAVTGADGTATVTPAAAGALTLRVERPASVRTALTVLVGEPAARAVAPARPAAPAPDRSAPAARLLGIREGDRFSRRRAPRVVRARVTADPSGLSVVKLRLTRRTADGCAYLSGRLERFRRARCGRGAYFRVGSSTSVSYLLPTRLTPGRYVLDVIAVDRAGNRDPLARGRNRVVFLVR